MKKSFKIEVRKGIEGIIPYSPGTPIEELERELGIRAIKLASNENPLGPSRAAIKAMEGALMGLHRYPDGACYELKKRLSRFLGIGEESLVIGNGSNEIIELLARTFLCEDDDAIMGEPSFAVYPLVAQAIGARVVKVGLKDFTIDLEGMSRAVTDMTRIVFIANPNNPTGTIVKRGELERFMDKLPQRVIVCLDEAYSEYVEAKDFPDSISYVKEHRPVVVMRTFSKIYGLAGLRVGYGMARPDIADYLNRVRQPFNVNSLAQIAATAALDDNGHVERSRKNNSEGLRYLFNEFKSLGYECVPTEANFFLLKVRDGEAVYNMLLRKGVIVRPLKSYGIADCIRITVGTPEENKSLVKAFGEIITETNIAKGVV